MYYEPTNAKAGKYVPNYVVVDSNKKTRTLYNPAAAIMACNMSHCDYDINTSNNNGGEALRYYGYTFINQWINGKALPLGKKKDDNGTEKEIFSSVNVTCGIKKVVYNGQKKYSVAIAFRGTHDIEDIITDISIIKDSAGLHSGFASTAHDFYNSFSKIGFPIDRLFMVRS